MRISKKHMALYRRWYATGQADAYYFMYDPETGKRAPSGVLTIFLLSPSAARKVEHRAYFHGARAYDPTKEKQ